MKQVYNPISGQYDLVGSGGVITGTINRIPFFDSATSISDSYLIQTPTGILIDAGKLILSSGNGVGSYSYIDLQDSYLDISIPSAGNSQIYLDANLTNIAGKEINGLSIVTNAANPSSQHIITIVPKSVSNKVKSALNDGNAFINGIGTFKANVKNSVIIANGINPMSVLSLYAKTDSTVYLNQLGYGFTGVNETIVGFTFPTASNSILFPNASGTLALTSQLTNEANILGGQSGVVAQLNTNYIVEFTGNGTYNLMDITLTTVKVLRIFAGVGTTVSIVPNGVNLINDVNAPISVIANTMVTLRKFSTGWRSGD